MAKNLAFHQNNLFLKARLYIQRALEEDREGLQFPFWLALSLEFLARSTLAEISPTLLADIRVGDDAAHLLYALGFESTQKPKSINMANVFDRLTKVNIDFTNEDKQVGLSIINQRNTELHTGLNGFEEFPVKTWLPDYYRIIKILLTAQGSSLVDFLGKEEARAAEAMIVGGIEKIKKNVLDTIASFTAAFKKLSRAEKTRLTKIASTRALSENKQAKVVKCPSCKADALIFGELISRSAPRLVEEAIQQERRYLPVEFQCCACGLKIGSFAELKVIDLAAQFTITDNLDPVRYHQIDVEDYVDVDALIREKGGIPDFDPGDLYGDE